MSRRSLIHRLSPIVPSRARRGQSLVEFTVLLPVLLIMISGVIEFGFMLNYYLDLIDAAREATRWAASDDPVHDVSGTWVDPNPSFYSEVQDVALDSINIGSGGQISLDPATDDVVISAFPVSGGAITTRYPGGSCAGTGLPLYGNHTSDFTCAEVQALLDPSAPNTGIVMVEIFYEYHMLLGLPWITAFVPDPIPLYAYTMMPNPNVEPTPTP